MLTKRVIPCLDVKDGRVVKGVNFVNLRDAGDPVDLANAYDEQGADEQEKQAVAAGTDNHAAQQVGGAFPALLRVSERRKDQAEGRERRDHAAQLRAKTIGEAGHQDGQHGGGDDSGRQIPARGGQHSGWQRVRLEQQAADDNDADFDKKGRPQLPGNAVQDSGGNKKGTDGSQRTKRPGTPRCQQEVGKTEQGIGNFTGQIADGRLAGEQQAMLERDDEGDWPGNQR